MTCPTLRPKDARLTFESENRSVDVGFASQDTRIVHKIACRKIISAIDNDVVVLKKLERVMTFQTRVMVSIQYEDDVTKTVLATRSFSPEILVP